ncbi:MAG: tol-pal system-associated acyl-CoA thioesterase [Oleiphilaceae bacterium]|jgi:tol-pal system-associated acyl-CoA thioesterase
MTFSKNQTISNFPVRVYIEDTDAGGIVFYANYLKYFERARTEFFRSRGFELRKGIAENINYVVHSLSVQYIQSARLDDELMISTQVIKIGKVFLIFNQKVFNQEKDLLVDADVKIACLHYDSAKPRRLPESLILSI